MELVRDKQGSVKIYIVVPESLTVMLLVASEGMMFWMIIKSGVFATIVTYILDFNPQTLGR